MTKADYDELVADREPALGIVEANLKILNRIYEISEIKTRIKTLDSIEEKCTRKGINFDSTEEVRSRIRDVAGARVVCIFKDDIPKIVNAIKQMPGIAVDTEKDYVSNPKENGYASYHIGAFVQVSIPGKGIKSIPVEIQIRTKSMDSWSATEHFLKYKSVLMTETSEVSERFARLSKLLAKVDEEFMDLRDYVTKLKKPAE